MPEPEAVLADWVGDMPAHAVGEAVRGAAGWSRRAGRAVGLNLAEYLQEESPSLVPPPLARSFYTEVDRLRDDVERAERRIELLERRLRDGKG
jgi:ubiquinone biosynthesis protein UbiJ